MIIFLWIAFAAAILTLVAYTIDLFESDKCGNGVCACRSDDERDSCKEWNR